MKRIIDEEQEDLFENQKSQIRRHFFLKKKPRVFQNKFGVRATDSFKVLLTSSANIFFLDIEETIFIPNIYYELLSKKYYINLFFEICKNETETKISDIVYFGRNYKRWLTEPSIPNIINDLRAAGKMVFALTSGAPSMQKRDRFKEFNIKLNGFLFTRGAEKGPFLVNFLKKNTLLTGKCCFVDNHLEKILNVQEHFQKEFDEQIECYHYTREFIPTVTRFGFVNYWKSVIEAIKKGELEVLRERIRQEVHNRRIRKNQQQEAKNFPIEEDLE